VHYDGAVPVTVRTFADASALMRKDQDFHIDGRGYDDIGYNFLVISAPGITAIDGLIFEGRGRTSLAPIASTTTGVDRRPGRHRWLAEALTQGIGLHPLAPRWLRCRCPAPSWYEGSPGRLPHRLPW
jgi:hypothetical protein